MKRFARDLLHESLGADTLEEAYRLESISKEIRDEYIKDPNLCEPWLQKALLDLNGSTTEEMQQSAWNQAFTYKIAKKAQSIAASFADHRFGSGEIDWRKLMQKRLYEYYLRQKRLQNTGDETNEEIAARIIALESSKKKRDSETSIRHHVREMQLVRSCESQ